MRGYCKLSGNLINSSVWDEPDSVRIVWITMLAMADAGGMVESSLASLARQSRKSKNETQKALLILQSPDSESKNPDNEGRRITKVEGGWLIFNYPLYRSREEVSDEPAAIATRLRVQKYRERKRLEKLQALQNVTGNVTVTLPALPTVTGVTSASASASASASKKGSTEGKEIPLLVRVRSLFNKRPETPLDKSESKAWQAAKFAVEATDEAEWQLLEWAYQQKTGNPHQFRRHDMATLLNNWNTEIDRARGWKQQASRIPKVRMLN